MIGMTILAMLSASLLIQIPTATGCIPTLAEAEAEADRLDPAWRMDALLQNRIKCRPEANAGLYATEIYESLPKPWRKLYKQDTSKLVEDGEPGPQSAWHDVCRALENRVGKPRDEILASARARLVEIAPILEKAHRIEFYQRGRSEVLNPRDLLGSSTPKVISYREIARVLLFECDVLRMEAKASPALANVRSILGLSRAVGDEPTKLGMIVRYVLDTYAAQSVIDVLSCANADEDSLRITQLAISAESSEPLLLTMLRGIRALNYELLADVARGESDVKELGGIDLEHPFVRGRENPRFRVDQAINLHLANKAVEIAKRPIHERAALWKVWEAEFRALEVSAPKSKHALAFMLFAEFDSMPSTLSESDIRTRTLLRLSELACGLERYRIAKGRWPGKGDSVASVFPNGSPLDPFTGKPLVWKTDENGLVIYSLSSDLTDNNGKIENIKFQTKGTDIGFRIPDPHQRSKLQGKLP